jgi:hypothetical protein
MVESEELVVLALWVALAVLPMVEVLLDIMLRELYATRMRRET